MFMFFDFVKNANIFVEFSTFYENSQNSFCQQTVLV